FWDPFSFKSNPELWAHENFIRLREKLASRAVLSTYTASSALRLSLCLAGFWIYRGPASGAKNETTWASTEEIPQWKEQLLGKEFVERLLRSSVETPFGAKEFFDKEKTLRALAQLSQFAEHCNNLQT